MTLKFLSMLTFQVDPYLGITDDFQVYVKPQHEVKDYGSASDNDEALSTLTEQREKAYESDKVVFDILVDSLSTITKVSSSMPKIHFRRTRAFDNSTGLTHTHVLFLFKFEADEIANQLTEGFVPDEAFILDSQLMLDMDHFQRAAHSKASLSFDGVCSVDCLEPGFMHLT